MPDQSPPTIALPLSTAKALLPHIDAQIRHRNASPPAGCSVEWYQQFSAETDTLARYADELRARIDAVRDESIDARLVDIRLQLDATVLGARQRAADGNDVDEARARADAFEYARRIVDAAFGY